MKVLLLVSLALAVAACSSVNVPLSPYRIDVQQGNALEQESVAKLKPGLTRSQVRFLLGTPLLVDPFHGNRWDYVYNFRKAGKLAEERRLALFFDGDVLARIEAEGLTLRNEQPEVRPAPPEQSAQTAIEQPRPEAAPVAVALPLENAGPLQPVAVPPAAEPPAATAAPVSAQPSAATAESAQPVQIAPVAAAAATDIKPAEAKPAESARAADRSDAGGVRSLEQTSIVPPLGPEGTQSAQAQPKPGAMAGTSTPPEPVALQAEANVEAIKPDVMPEFPGIASPDAEIMAALNAWADAWRARDEESYLAAYAPSFRPEGGQTREQWETRRRLLLGVSRNIDLQIDGVAAGVVGVDRAEVSFRQYYRSDTYRDAVIKLLKFVRVDNRWLIEEEKVLAPIRGNP